MKPAEHKPGFRDVQEKMVIRKSRELIAATRNKGKITELEEVLAELGYHVSSLEQWNTLPDAPETGTSFLENSIQKATYYCKATGQLCLADDSGLEVDALQGSPGVYSARYAGETANADDNNAKLLRELAATPPAARTARFRCAVALVAPDGWQVTAEGVVSGMILNERRGSGGFGYDPLFYLPEYGKTMAELTLAEKNQISHRGKALRALAARLAAGD